MNVVDLYGIDSSLKKQVELTKKIIERMDIMIDAMKRDLNIDAGKSGDMTHFYTPSGKKEWIGIPDSLDEMFGRVFSTERGQKDWFIPESNDDDLDQMDACLVRNVAKAQRKTILKMEQEIEALRAIIDDMRGQINEQ